MKISKISKIALIELGFIILLLLIGAIYFCSGNRSIAETFLIAATIYTLFINIKTLIKGWHLIFIEKEGGIIIFVYCVVIFCVIFNTYFLCRYFVNNSQFTGMLPW